MSISINSWTDLNAVRNNLSADYILNTNLSSISAGYVGIGDSLIPIGTQDSPFTGTFNGNNYTISNLTINVPTSSYVGLFGYASGNISNLNLTNINITGSQYVGGLIGYFNAAILSGCSASGTISSTIIESNPTYLPSYVGGLVGYLAGDGTGIISKCYSSGNVIGSAENHGGLVGYKDAGTIINNSYSNANVTSYQNADYGTIGGLVGYGFYGSIDECFATGLITVPGTYAIGGLVGRSYYTTINHSYWDINSTGNSNLPAGAPTLNDCVGYTTTQMKTLSTFTNGGWDIGVTPLTGNNGYPYLAWQNENNTPTWVIYEPVPNAPTINSIIPGNSNVTLSYTAGIDNGPPVDYFGITTSPSTSTTITSSSPVIINGLTNGNTYAFTMSAHNALGYSTSSNVVSAVPGISNATTYTFTGPISGVVNTITDNFIITPNDIYTGTITISSSDLGISNTILTFSNSLTPQIFTVTPSQSGLTTFITTNSGALINPSPLILSINATLPSEPRFPITIPGNNNVILSWSTPVNNGGSIISDYIVDYKVSTYPSWTTLDTNSTNLNTVISGLTNDISYDFKIQALNIIGASQFSTTVSATPTQKRYLGIFSTGQDNAIGAGAAPAITITQPYNNISLTPGPRGLNGPLIPLIETYQVNQDNVVLAWTDETPSAGLANSLHAYDPLSSPVFVGLHGFSNPEYQWLKKGSQAYVNGMTQAMSANLLVANAGGILIPVAVTAIHGENNYVFFKSEDYEADIIQWQNDYETDLNAIVGTSSLHIPMFILQMNSGATGELAIEQYNAHINAPGKIVLIGPAYQYIRDTDNYHFTNISERNIGEMFAKVINHVKLNNNTWNPLMPTTVSGINNVVTIDYNIPVGSLALDTTTVSARPNYGFTFTQISGSSVSISSVQLINGNTQAQITFNKDIDGLNPTIRYAWGGGNGSNLNVSCGNPLDPVMVGGNIRDMDNSISPSIDSSNIPLYNWSIAFEKPITIDYSSHLIISNISNIVDVNTANILAWTNNLANTTLSYGPTTAYGTNVYDLSANNHSFVLSGLIPNTTYHYNISATDIYNNSLVSNDYVFLTKINAVPNTPTIGTAVAGDNGAIVTFTAPTSNNSPAIIDYTVISNPDNITAIVSNTTTTVVVTGLTNGIHYTFKVKARNSVGYSNLSLSSNSIIPTGNPKSPNGLYVYDNALATEWSDYSWGTFTNTYNSYDRAYTGMYSIKSILGPYAGFNLGVYPFLDLSIYESLHFAVYSSTTMGIIVSLYDSNSTSIINVNRTIYSGWNVVIIALSELNPTQKIIEGFSIQNNVNSTEILYFDDIKFIDMVKPFIADVSCSAASTVSLVKCITDKLTDSTVMYGTTSAYSASSTSTTVASAHAIIIPNLEPFTKYYYKMEVEDPAGNIAISSENTFTTLSSTFGNLGISINGNSYFLMGANYPWLNYGLDFGGDTVWGTNGVAKNYTQINTDMANMSASGVDVVRWWVFSDSRAGITYDLSGTPTGVVSGFFKDLDAAIEIANINHIQLVLSLFDFGYLYWPSSYSGLTMGGHSDVLRDPIKTDALITYVINPIMQRYASEFAILAWEIMNEPEWIIYDIPQPSPNSGADCITLTEFYNFASKISASIHQFTSSYVTIGSASLKWNRIWTNVYADQRGFNHLNLDFYQSHYYPWMDNIFIPNDPDLGTTWLSPFQQNVLDLQLDKPMVIGELEGNATTYDQYNTLLKNGYVGIWPWSYYVNWNIDWVTFTSWKNDNILITETYNPTLITIPSAPTSVTAFGQNGVIIVSYSVPLNNGNSPIIDYTITTDTGMSVTTSAMTAAIAGLTNNVTYNVSVKARNAIGSSVPSIRAAAVPTSSSNAGPTVPDAPINVRAMGSNNAAIVTFNAPVNNGNSPIIDYTITSNYDDIITTTLTNTIFTGLTNGISYTFTVTARNIIGSSIPSVASTPIIPNSNTIIVSEIQAFGNNSALLTDGYDLYYQNGPIYTSITNNPSGGSYSEFIIKEIPDDIMYLKIKNGNIFFTSVLTSANNMFIQPITNFPSINKKEQYSFDYIIQDVNSKYNSTNSPMYIFKSDRFALISNGTNLTAVNPLGDTYIIA